MQYKSIYFQDVLVGDELTPLTMVMTMELALMTVAASRDWNPLHYNREFCQKEAKRRDMFAGTWFYLGMFTRFATDWAGPTAKVSKLRFDMRESVCPGDDMKIEGKVVAKRVEGARHLIDLEVCVSNQFGPTTPGTMTIELPSRE